MQNDMRDRLIDLIAIYDETYDCETCTSENKGGRCGNKCLADHLIANGVVLPPCKVGQTVWFIRNKEVIETCVEKIILKQGGLYIKLCCNSMYETTCNSIDRTVFFTKEQAEQKLKELSENAERNIKCK